MGDGHQLFGQGSAVKLAGVRLITCFHLTFNKMSMKDFLGCVLGLSKLVTALGSVLEQMGFKLATSFNALKDFGTELSNYGSSHLN